jgi:hypothetical protein
VKTYACNKATPNSNINIKNKGIKNTSDNIKSVFVKFNMKLTIICTKVWPANILAANLIDKLNNLIKYEKISIGINIGNKTKGHCGIKICKNFKWNLNNPIVNIDIQIVLDNKNINIKWLVKAIPKGIKLNKLQNKIKLNNVNINGNQNKPYECACCFINPAKKV